jgi:hypothetical protein
MYVRMHIYIYICTHTYTFIHAYIRIYIWTYIHARIRAYIAEPGRGQALGKQSTRHTLDTRSKHTVETRYRHTLGSRALDPASRAKPRAKTRLKRTKKKNQQKIYAQSLALDGRTEHPTKLDAHINRHELSKVRYIWWRLQNVVVFACI